MASRTLICSGGVLIGRNSLQNFVAGSTQPNVEIPYNSAIPPLYRHPTEIYSCHALESLWHQHLNSRKVPCGNYPDAHEQHNKRWCIHIMDYHTAMRRWTLTTTCTKMDNILRCKIEPKKPYPKELMPYESISIKSTKVEKTNLFCYKSGAWWPCGSLTLGKGAWGWLLGASRPAFSVCGNVSCTLLIRALFCIKGLGNCNNPNKSMAQRCGSHGVVGSLLPYSGQKSDFCKEWAWVWQFPLSPHLWRAAWVGRPSIQSHELGFAGYWLCNSEHVMLSAQGWVNAHRLLVGSKRGGHVKCLAWYPAQGKWCYLCLPK